MSLSQVIVDEQFKSLIPPLTDEERGQLLESLKKEGCRDPLVVWEEEGILIDGHNRHELCLSEAIGFETVGRSFDSRAAAEEWVIRNQFGRRNLTPAQRVELALRLEEAIREKAKANQQLSEGRGVKGLQNSADLKPVDTRAELAKIAGVSHDTVAKVKRVLESGDESLINNLRQGEISVNQAHSRVRREEAKSAHENLVASVATTPRPVLDIADLVVADPPWRYDHQEAANRDIENHYPTATLDEIKGHKPKTSENAILLLWATAPKLIEGIEVLESWGFTYKTHAIWDKEIVGMGYWFRGQHELILVGVKGNPGATPEPARRSSVFREQRGRHSKKPDCFYEWVEYAFPDKVKLEMYCRSPRNGWMTWGNEV